MIEVDVNHLSRVQWEYLSVLTACVNFGAQGGNCPCAGVEGSVTFSGYSRSFMRCLWRACRLGGMKQPVTTLYHCTEAYLPSVTGQVVNALCLGGHVASTAAATECAMTVQMAEGKPQVGEHGGVLIKLS